MKKLAIILSVLLFLSVCLCAPAAAAEDVIGTYTAISCSLDGEDYPMNGEYITLMPDGTGEVGYSDAVFEMKWTYDGAVFYFADEAGDEFENGTISGGVITGAYMGYDYKYARTAAGQQEPQPAAQEPSESMTFYAKSRVSGGAAAPCNGEYVVLNADGTGTVVFEACAYTLSWQSSEEGISFADNMGNQFSGKLEGGVLSGVFHESDYTYTQGESIPMMALSPATWGTGLAYVTDQADILTDGEEQQLSEKAAAISEQYHCNTYIVTLDDMRGFSSVANIETCAEEIRTGYSLGYGSGKDCVMLLLSMAERDYDLMAFGDFGNASFTDYGKDAMESNFLDNFSDDDWFGGFSDYLDESDRLLAMAAQGEPLDVGSAPGVKVYSVLAAVLLGALVAFVFCSIIKSGMKAVKVKTEAGNYIPQGGTTITYRDDRFTHTTEQRIYDPPKSSSGGGTTTSSSGHSHSSGKF